MEIDIISNVICNHAKLQFSELIEENRKREVIQYRQIAMYFSKIKSKKSLSVIGKYYGGRDHATVLHSIKVVNNIKDTESEYRLELYEIEKKLDIALSLGDKRQDHILRSRQQRSEYYRTGLNR